MQFYANRGLIKKQKFVGINGVGFFDWQKEKATLPSQENIKTDLVKANFMEWEDKISDESESSEFIKIEITLHCAQFEMIENVVNLGLL